MTAVIHPMTVQEQTAMVPQPGAQCTECGAGLRSVSLQLQGGAELLIAYWCPEKGCYRYGQHTHVFALGAERRVMEVPKTRRRRKK